MRAKQFLGIVLAGVMAASLMGCGSTGKTPKESVAGESVTGESAAGESVAGESAAGKEKENPPEGQWKPTHDITIRVPNAAGGTMDTITRIIAQGIQKGTGTTVMVNNLTGASGAIAANDLLSNKADMTEMMTSGIALFTLAPLFNQDIKVNLDDFTIISGLVSEDFVLCVNPGKSGIKDFEGLLEYGKTNRILFGSNTPGGSTHMLGTALFGEAGVNGEAVTSDGTNKDMLALVGGDVTCAIGNSSACQQFIEEGTAVPILVFSPEPYTGFEGYTVPTAVEKGFDIQFKSCNFLMAKKGVEEQTVNQVYEMIKEYTQTDEFKELAASAKYVPDLTDGAAAKAVIEQAAGTCQNIYDKYYK